MSPFPCCAAAGEVSVAHVPHRFPISGHLACFNVLTGGASMNISVHKSMWGPPIPYLGFFFGLCFQHGILGSQGHHVREVPAKSATCFSKGFASIYHPRMMPKASSSSLIRGAAPPPHRGGPKSQRATRSRLLLIENFLRAGRCSECFLNMSSRDPHHAL